MRFNMSQLVFAALFVLSACTPKQEGMEDPKRRLNDYISQSFAVRGPEDRKQLTSFLTGEAKTRLDAWSDDQFRHAFMDAKRQFIKFSPKEVKPISAHEVSITYELSYTDQGRGHDAKVTHRKLARLVQEQGKWLISEVSNIKELVEYRNEMSLP